MQSEMLRSKVIQKETGYFKSFDDTKVYYEVRGEGKPLIFCYGIGCLFNHWHHQIKFFSEHYKVIVFDYRAHQKTQIPSNPQNLTLEALAKDVHHLMKHLEIESAGFLAHSFGAQVLTKAYDLYPEHFDSVTFINGFVDNPIKGMFGSDLPNVLFNYMKKGVDILPETVTYIWKLALNNPISIPISGLLGGFNLGLTSYKDIEIYAKGISQIDLKSFLKLFDQMMKYDGTEVLERLKVPTLIIAGEKDSVTPLKHQEQMSKLIADSELTVMPYGSHCTQLDLPVFVNLRIEKFLKKHGY